MDLTGIILTHNEAHNIEAAIGSLRLLTTDILVFDSFSQDETPTLAEQTGARVVQHPFKNYGAQRNAALDSVTAEWVFFLDADERLTSDLASEIQGKLDHPERGWWVPRHNYIFGHLTDAAGWYPDYQLRLLHRASARYDPARPVHEVVILDGESGYLEHHLLHYNYSDLQQFIRKQESYTEFEAERRFEEGMQPKLYSYLTLPMKHFWWRYVTEQGYRLGVHGLLLSLLMAYYELQTWRQVAKLWRGS